MKPIDIRNNWGRLGVILLLPCLAIIFLVIATKTVHPVEYPNRDFFTFWLSGRLASQGQDPYSSQIWVAGHHQSGADWIPNQTFIYPLPLSLFFVPFGRIPLYQSFILWNILTQVMILSSFALLWMANSKLSGRHYILPLLTGIVLFRPTILTLIHGQLSGFLLIMITSIIYLWERNKWSKGAAILAFLALKPNLGFPLIGLLSIYLIQRKQSTALIAGTASGVLLLLAGFFQNPGWLVEFWNAGNTKLSQTFGFSPTTWGISAFFCNYNFYCTIGAGIGLALIFLAGYIYLLVMKRDALSPALVVNLAISITLLLTPYTWPYDQLLLVAPIVTITIRLAKDGYKFLPVSLIFLGFDILAFILLAISAKNQMEIWNMSIPLLSLGLLVWYLLKYKTRSRVAEVIQPPPA